MATRDRRATLAAYPETCGACAFGVDVIGEDSLQCHGLPPHPLMAPDCTVSWHRGGPVEPADPACAFYRHRGRA